MPTVCGIGHHEWPLRGCASDVPSIRNLRCDRLYISCIPKCACRVLIQPFTLHRVHVHSALLP